MTGPKAPSFIEAGMNALTSKKDLAVLGRQFSRIGSSLTFAVEVANLTAAMSKDEKLANSTYDSLRGVLLDAASWGLTLSTTQRLMYVVAYYNKKIGKYEAQAIPSYMGMIQMVTRSGRVLNVQTGIVCEGGL